MPSKKNNKQHVKQTKLGIIGGGQLARMMVLAAQPLGIEVHILSDHANDPAAQVTQFWQKGNSHSLTTLKKFCKKVSALTFESEFANLDKINQTLKSFKTSTSKAPYVFPRTAIMSKIQDRLSQKKLLQKYNLPTSPFLKVNNLTDFKKALAQFDSQMVLKKRRFGYDGFGTFIIKKNISDSDISRIATILKESPDGFIAEQFIPFQKESAFLITRAKSGQCAFFPFVESHQKDSQCLWVKGPLVETTAHKKLQRAAAKMLDDIKYVGIIAIELFETKNGLLINELAPRVHNSGHYSQDALCEDQFQAHIKSGLNIPFVKNCLLNSGFAMLNLSGTTFIPTTDNGHLHWYGKSLSRPGRKMGHINYLADSPEKALKLAMKDLKIITS